MKRIVIMLFLYCFVINVFSQKALNLSYSFENDLEIKIDTILVSGYSPNLMHESYQLVFIYGQDDSEQSASILRSINLVTDEMIYSILINTQRDWNTHKRFLKKNWGDLPKIKKYFLKKGSVIVYAPSFLFCII